MSPVSLRNAAVGVTLALSLPSCHPSPPSKSLSGETDTFSLVAGTLPAVARQTSQTSTNSFLPTQSELEADDKSRPVDMFQEPFIVADGERLRQLVIELRESEELTIAGQLLASHRRVGPILTGFRSLSAPSESTSTFIKVENAKIPVPNDFICQFKTESNPLEDSSLDNKNCGPVMLVSIARSLGRASLDPRKADLQIENARQIMGASKIETTTTGIENIVRGARILMLRADARQNQRVSCVQRKLGERYEAIVMVNAIAFGGKYEDHYIRVKEIKDSVATIYDSTLEHPLKVKCADLEKGMAAGRGFAVYIIKGTGRGEVRNYNGPTLDNLPVSQ